MQKLTVRDFGTTKKGETAHLYEMKKRGGDHGGSVVITAQPWSVSL